MMDRTDRHFRAFLRRLTHGTLLYSEMVTTGAVDHGDRERLLGHDPEEGPLALQLGGEGPAALARCAIVAAEWGYDEVNLNVGCPSDRVRHGAFGACLMSRPEVVAEAVAAMRDAVDLPVTVKHRIGIDDLDRYEDLAHFVDVVASAGCDRFIVHARVAILDGLTPKENRTVPPLRHADVYRLKREFPALGIEINGGITSLDQARRHLRSVDGVMIGRAAYDDPYLFASADRDLLADPAATPPTRRQVVEAMIPYVERWRSRDLYLSHVTRHMLGLYAGVPGARAWRRYLTEESIRPGAGAEVLLRSLDLVPAEL